MQCGENLLRFETRFDTPAGGLAAWWRIETWAREGVYLGSQLPVDALPGKAGQVRARPGMALDRVFFNRNLCSEMKLFWRLFSKLVSLC